MANGLAFYDKDFVVIKKDVELVAESITRIVMTNPGERVGQPYFGVGLRNMLFDQLDDDFTSSLENNIKDQMLQYEPRADLTSLDITSYEEENYVKVKLGFTMKGDAPENENILTYTIQLE